MLFSDKLEEAILKSEALDEMFEGGCIYSMEPNMPKLGDIWLSQTYGKMYICSGFFKSGNPKWIISDAGRPLNAI